MLFFNHTSFLPWLWPLYSFAISNITNSTYLVFTIQSSIQVCEGSLVLVFECSEEVMVGRLVERGKTSGRVDDNKETIRKRLTTYNEATLPVIEHFQIRNKVKKVTWANCCQICKAFSTCYQKWRVSNV